MLYAAKILLSEEDLEFVLDEMRHSAETSFSFHDFRNLFRLDMTGGFVLSTMTRGIHSFQEEALRLGKDLPFVLPLRDRRDMSSKSGRCWPAHAPPIPLPASPSRSLKQQRRLPLPLPSLQHKRRHGPSSSKSQPTLQLAAAASTASRPDSAYISAPANGSSAAGSTGSKVGRRRRRPHSSGQGQRGVGAEKGRREGGCRPLTALPRGVGRRLAELCAVIGFAHTQSQWHTGTKAHRYTGNTKHIGS